MWSQKIQSLVEDIFDQNRESFAIRHRHKVCKVGEWQRGPAKGCECSQAIPSVRRDDGFEHIAKRWSPLGCDADTLPEIENAAETDGTLAGYRSGYEPLDGRFCVHETASSFIGSAADFGLAAFCPTVCWARRVATCRACQSFDMESGA